MARLRQLIDPDTYRACDWDLKRDAAGRAYWLAHFRRHLESQVELIRRQYPDAVPAQIERFRADYLETLGPLENEPERQERIDVLRLDELRHDVLRRHGFEDPYRDIKDRENAAALTVLPRLLAELDAVPPAVRIEKLAAGMLAGNMFDLGAPAAVERYQDSGLDFWGLRSGLPERPWLIDDLDCWRRRWLEGRPYRHVLLFVDNAGPDICLGCLPLARWMLRAGSRVTLAANEAPALNDVTALEVAAILKHASPADETLAGALAQQQLAVVSTGGRAPLLDLGRLAHECASIADDADLIILNGMGRAVESNFHARFTCDALSVAVLKDEAVAARLGGRLFDCIFRFQAASPAADRTF